MPRTMENFTVKDLTLLLKGLPPHAKIALARDEEGNGFYRLWRVTVEPDDSEITIWPMHDEI